MAPGVVDLRELLRPVAFAALRYLLPGPSLPRAQAYQSLTGFPLRITYFPLLSGSDRAELKSASAAHQT